MTFYGQAGKPNAGDNFNASYVFSNYVYNPRFMMYNMDGESLAFMG